MGKSRKKPRPKFDARQFVETVSSQQKKERDLTFDDIARSKARRR